MNQKNDNHNDNHNNIIEEKLTETNDKRLLLLVSLSV